MVIKSSSSSGGNVAVLRYVNDSRYHLAILGYRGGACIFIFHAVLLFATVTASLLLDDYVTFSLDGKRYPSEARRYSLLRSFESSILVESIVSSRITSFSTSAVPR